MLLAAADESTRRSAYNLRGCLDGCLEFRERRATGGRTHALRRGAAPPSTPAAPRLTAAGRQACATLLGLCHVGQPAATAAARSQAPLLLRASARGVQASTPGLLQLVSP